MNDETLNNLLAEANECNNTGNYDEAETLANDVLKKLNIPSPSLLRERLGETDDQDNLDNRGARKEAKRSEELHCAALITLSTTKWRRGDLHTALSLALASIDIAEEINIPELKAKALSNCAVVYANLSDYANSLMSLEKALSINEEIGSKNGSARNLGDIGNIYICLSDYPNALMYHQKALTIFEDISSKNGIANSLGNIGLVYANLSDYANALTYYQKARAINEEIGRKEGIAYNLGNIGNVYVILSDYANALTYYQKALTINEEIGKKDGIAKNLSSIGIVYRELLDYANALTYYQKALSIHEEIGSKIGIAINLGNIGNAYADLSEYTKSLTYYQKSLTIFEEIGSLKGIAINLGSIGTKYATLDFEGYDSAKAEEFLMKAIALCMEIGEKLHLYDFHKSLADLFKHEKRWEECQLHFEKYHNLKEEVRSEEATKQAGLMEQRRQAEEREKQIAITKAAADAKHQATEQLLHNVLPPSIANKMLDGTKLIAEKIPSVSVLFADIVGFTKLSQRITPEELVEGLDGIFSAFDALAEKHGLEKIKTIGDAYMVVSGAPVQRQDHAESMALFAIEMVDAMKEFRSISSGEEIQLRIGIHSGEVVAGVIGKKKFAYDLWGDAVNTASRMESHGEAGKIHCTEEFVRALSLSSFQSFQFVERGEMTIKGKGVMKTYFLELTNY